MFVPAQPSSDLSPSGRYGHTMVAQEENQREFLEPGGAPTLSSYGSNSLYIHGG